MRFETFDDWADWIDDEFDEMLDAAVESRDGARVVALHDEAWESFPGEHDDQRLQGIVSSALGHFHDLRQWDASARWVPRMATLYGAQEPSVRFHRGVTAWNTGDAAAGQAELAKLYEDFGPNGFLPDPGYVAVARGEVSAPAGEPVAAENAEALSVDDPRVQGVAEQVNDAMDTGRWDEAIGLCREGLSLLGDPRSADGAMWFLGTMGDAYVEQEQWAEARDTFALATQVPGGMENPYIQLRLGQSEYELGNERPAANGLIAAYMQAPDILDEEPPKYLKFLQEQGLIDS